MDERRADSPLAEPLPPSSTLVNDLEASQASSTKISPTITSFIQSPPPTPPLLPLEPQSGGSAEEVPPSITSPAGELAAHLPTQLLPYPFEQWLEGVVGIAEIPEREFGGDIDAINELYDTIPGQPSPPQTL